MGLKLWKSNVLKGVIVYILGIYIYIWILKGVMNERISGDYGDIYGVIYNKIFQRKF